MAAMESAWPDPRHPNQRQESHCDRSASRRESPSETLQHKLGSPSPHCGSSRQASPISLQPPTPTRSPHSKPSSQGQRYERPIGCHRKQSPGRSGTDSGDRQDDGGEFMTPCLSAHVLWDANNAKMFGALCRRSLRLCEDGQPCPLIPDTGRILLVSSQRGLTSTAYSTAPTSPISPETSSIRPSRRNGQTGP